MKKKKTDKNKYISLKEAAKISGYAPDYIGYLIREGKIKGKAVSLGRNWFTTSEAIAKYQTKKEKKKKLSKYSKAQRIFWYKKLTDIFLKSPRYALSAIIFLFAGFSALVIYAIPSNEVKIEIFPTVWEENLSTGDGEVSCQNGQNALIRELDEESFPAEFNSENSCFLNVKEITFLTVPPEEEEPFLEEEALPEEEEPIEEEPIEEEPQPEEQTFLQKFFSRFSFLSLVSAQEMETGITNDELQEVSDTVQEIEEPEEETTEEEGNNRRGNNRRGNNRRGNNRRGNNRRGNNRRGNNRRGNNGRGNNGRGSGRGI
jgi:hypothetical protein